MKFNDVLFPIEFSALVPLSFSFINMKFLSNSIRTINLSYSSVVKRLFISTLIIISALVLGNPLTANEAFATHEHGELKWQMVFVSSSSGCSNYQYQMLNKYSEITDKYLAMYNLENFKYEPLCFPITKYSSEYQSPDDLDLIVLVIDRNLGEAQLHVQKMGGLYTHIGTDREQNHSIVVCDCPNFYYSDPIWILTHELSHFALNYRGYDSSMVEGLVHSNDERYDQCREYSDKSCKPFIMKLRLDSFAHSFNVMPIYEPAKNKKIANDVPVAVFDLTKAVTKEWINGKIADEDFVTFLELMANYTSFSSNEKSEIIFADEPLDKNRITWEDIISVDRNEETKDFLSIVPNNLRTNDVKFDTQEQMQGLPSWLKKTATWWVEDKITNEDFMKNIEFLSNEGII